MRKIRKSEGSKLVSRPLTIGTKVSLKVGPQLNTYHNRVYIVHSEEEGIYRLVVPTSTVDVFVFKQGEHWYIGISRHAAYCVMIDEMTQAMTYFATKEQRIVEITEL